MDKQQKAREEDILLRGLIARYQKENDERAFDKLFKHFDRHINAIVSRYNYDKNELISEANYRFIAAVQNFDLNRDTKVTTYIYQTINTYCKNYLRRYTPMMGKRSGVGSPEAIYCESLDVITEKPTDEFKFNLDQEIVQQKVIECIEQALNEDELEVVKHFFGIEDKDEPTYSNTLKRREDAPHYSTKEKKWVVDAVDDKLKLARIARTTKRSRKEVERLYETAITKLRDNPIAEQVFGNYIQYSTTQFSNF